MNSKNSLRKNRTGKIIITISIIFAALFVVSLVMIPVMVMPMFLGQRYEQEQFNSADYGVESERITLTTGDSVSLAAWRTRTDAPKGTVIILSGLQNPSVTAFFGYAKMFGDNGWDALLIEMRARGESGGDEIGFGMTEWLDVKAGVDFLAAEEKTGGLPIAVMGTSMGGGTVLIAAGEIPEIDAVISISAFSSFSDLFTDNMAMFGMPKLIAVLDIPFLNIYAGFHYGFNALKYSPSNAVAKLGERPLLLMHSTEDTQVPYPEFEKLLDKANKNGIQTSTFIRGGDEHFVCYEKYLDSPVQDTEFSQAILNFLGDLT
jgi:fermentation-respiration switch protein FrsA (DUF1100 family)